MRLFPFFAIALLYSMCKPAENTNITASDVYDSDAPTYVIDIEKAHQKEKFHENESICFTLDMTFGKNNRVMKFFTSTNSSAIRVEKKDGPTTVMQNGAIYTNADSTKWKGEQFGIYTYQYFFMLPYKLSEKGTQWTKLSDMELEGINTNLAKLTFESGTGDAPDDWYMIHSDPENNQIQYAGYIVTGGGRSQEEAEKNAHAIKYLDYEIIDGVPIARKWEFYDYNKESGIGKKIGEGILKNILFMDHKDVYDVTGDPEFSKIN